MVTPYEIDMRFANIINKGDGKDSGKDLYAANADGNYIGFMGATSWEAFLSTGSRWYCLAHSQIGQYGYSVLPDN